MEDEANVDTFSVAVDGGRAYPDLEITLGRQSWQMQHEDVSNHRKIVCARKRTTYSFTWKA